MYLESIKTETIHSFNDYLEVVKIYSAGYHVFRGHADGINWKLEPSITRIPDDREFIPISQDISYRQLETDMFLRFKRLAYPYLKSIPKTTIDWLVLGQHYGLPTRLLDWTENPLVALFFSLIEIRDCESAVWIILPNKWYTIDIDVESIDDIYLFLPQAIDNRIISQKGCFTIHPLPETLDRFIPIEEEILQKNISIQEVIKVIIPNDIKLKKHLFLQLVKMGFDFNFIFPDLIGLTKQIKFEYTNALRKL
jgi:hypothetical protein